MAESTRGGRDMKTLEEVRALIRAHQGELGRRYKARVIGLFGSFARGEPRPDSDLDILAAFGPDVSLLDLGGAQAMLSELLGMKVDLVPREDIRPELRKIIESETVLI